VWYEDRYSDSWKGWKLAKDWYQKIDWLEKVVILNRDPKSLPKPWIAERERRERQSELNYLMFQYGSHLHFVNNILSSIGYVVEQVNQRENRTFKGKTLGENVEEKIEALRYQIGMARQSLGRIQGIKAIDLPPHAVLGGNGNAPSDALVLSPNQPTKGKKGKNSQ